MSVSIVFFSHSFMTFSSLIANYCFIFKCITQHDQYVSFLIIGKNEFDPEEDAHVIGDCVKVWLQS